jgi:hypothetical protein
LLAQLRTLRSTTGGTCRRDLQLSHRPDGNLADVLTSTLACTTAAGALVNFSKYVLQRPSMFPIAPVGKLLTCLPQLTLAQLRLTLGQLQNVGAAETFNVSHLPYVRLTFGLLFAGRWCRSLRRHSDHLIVHHQWEFSLFCARSSSKVPNAPMGNSRFAHCLQGGGVAVAGGTVTISSCTISGNAAYFVRAHPQKFPMPRWEHC